MAPEQKGSLFFRTIKSSLVVLVITGLVFAFTAQTPHHRYRRHFFDDWAKSIRAKQAAREAQDHPLPTAEPRPKSETPAEAVADLNAQAEAKWRLDIEVAHATDSPGVVPPMLDVSEAANVVIVTNRLDDRAVCVSLQRVSRRSERPNDYDRCHFDTNTCRELAPHATVRFTLYHTANPAACLSAPLEFRVGTALDPEPTWWSSTALEDFDARPPTEPLDPHSPRTWPLGGDVAKLKALLAEQDRAQRWRREVRP